MSAPSVLSPPISDRSIGADLERLLKTYTNVVAIFSEGLKTRFCVFYDRKYTLDAFRFALSRERTVDFGQYVLLRNDAHCVTNAVLSRSRAYTAPIEDFWRLILKCVVSSDPVEKARGLLDLFDNVVKSFYPQPMTHSSNWTPVNDWYSRLNRTRELSMSLHLDLQIGHVESRWQRYGAERLLHLNEFRRGTAPFHFALA